VPVGDVSVVADAVAANAINAAAATAVSPRILTYFIVFLLESGLRRLVRSGERAIQTARTLNVLFLYRGRDPFSTPVLVTAVSILVKIYQCKREVCRR